VLLLKHRVMAGAQVHLLQQFVNALPVLLAKLSAEPTCCHSQ
jgi:hypothetical protein